MTEKRQTSQGYIIRILQHFATKLWNITNFVMLFQAVMKFFHSFKHFSRILQNLEFIYAKFLSVITETLIVSSSLYGRFRALGWFKAHISTLVINFRLCLYSVVCQEAERLTSQDLSRCVLWNAVFKLHKKHTNFKL